MAASIRERCSEANVEFVRLLCVTNDGMIRGQAVNVDHLESALSSGIPLPKMTQSFNAIGYRVKDGRFDAVGEVRLLPDPSTFRVLPYEDRTAAVLCDLVEHDRDVAWDADPRAAAKRMLTACEEEGLAPTIAVEQEFHLYSEQSDGEIEPLDPRGEYSSASMRASRSVILDIVDALKAQGIDVRKHHPEYTAGKNEIVVGHGTGLEPLDNAVFCRETVSGVAERAGASATFSPYPFDGATNGCHLHLSLWDGEENVFAPADDDAALSQRGRYFVGGILEHMPGLLALTSPTVNSYARLQPAKSVCAYNCWGIGNREAAVRVPEVRPSNRTSGTRIEFRPADNTSNPYLAVVGLLAAGRDGIDRELDPGPSVDQDPENLSDDTRRKRGIERLPRSLGEAVRELGNDEVLTAALGDTLTESYVEIKRSQWEAFTAHADTWMRGTYRERF
ncbi:glutamine synthetase family protein (plasmid) [Haloferax larsenii]|uniref:Glutamine synthetase family protein n=1 Tax=Haloferax larsenii TaxID=302484 RepID=A0ABY5RIY0_HALLR|nr:gamma-glutamylputrescine synthetase [Haloferax larsenii]UVE52321.1 glutamine synthetase family protein [Haloferax larsenii]